MQIQCVSPPGAPLGEGALWDAERGLVWWADIKSPAIHAHHAATGANHVQPLSFRLTALGLARDGRLVGACDHGFVRLAVAKDLKVSTFEILAKIDEPAGNRFNDGKVDAAGRFWAGTMATCPTFAGERLDRLYVTSATVGLSTEILAGQPLAGGLLALAPGIRGRPPARFAG